MYSYHTVEDREEMGKMKLNEPGRQKLRRQKPCKQAQHVNGEAEGGGEQG